LAAEIHKQEANVVHDATVSTSSSVAKFPGRELDTAFIDYWKQLGDDIDGSSVAMSADGNAVHNLGDSIDLTFSNGNPSDLDWIAIYPAGAGDSGTVPAGSEMWLYTCGSQGCAAAFPEGTLSFGASGADESGYQAWPLAAGSYQAYLVCCNGYDVVAASSIFEVESGQVERGQFTMEAGRKRK
jgi:hypothetical protein